MRVETNPKQSLVVGRNGTHKLAAIEIWEGSNGTLFIDGFGVSGKCLNAGFMIDKTSAKKIYKALNLTDDEIKQYQSTKMTGQLPKMAG